MNLDAGLGMARLSSLSVDAIALGASIDNHRSPEKAPHYRPTHKSQPILPSHDPMQDDLTRALERLNESSSLQKRASIHVSPPRPRKMVDAKNSVAYWQGIAPEETLRHILEYVHDNLGASNQLDGNVKVVLTYAGTEVWLLLPLGRAINHPSDVSSRVMSEPTPRQAPKSTVASDPLHAAKIASIHKDTERALARLLRVVDRMAAAMSDYSGASLVGTQVNYRVFGYEIRIEIEAGVAGILAFTEARKSTKREQAEKDAACPDQAKRDDRYCDPPKAPPTHSFADDDRSFSGSANSCTWSGANVITSTKSICSPAKW